MPLPRDLNSGDVLPAAWLNQLKAEVLRSIVGDGNILCSRTGQSLTIALAARIPGVAPRPWLARITATAAMGSSDSRFVYTIEEVTLSITLAGSDIDGATVTIKGNGRTGKAINLAEMANEADTGIAFSVDRAGTDYPDGFAPRPITGGGEDNTHQTNQIVWVLGSVRVVESETTHTIFFFDRQGHHDGACAAP